VSDNKPEKHADVTIIETAKHDKTNPQGELFPESLVKEMLDVERRRIESMDKKTEMQLKFIEASDSSDERQYHYQMARLTSEDVDRNRKHSLVRVIILGGGGLLFLGTAVLIGMMFWGNPIQSALAVSIFEKLLIGLGGYGVFSGLASMIRKLVNDHTKL